MHGEAYHQAVATGREIILHRPMDGGTTTRLLD